MKRKWKIEQDSEDDVATEDVNRTSSALHWVHLTSELFVIQKPALKSCTITTFVS
jgi:hypothetical protein